jgi:hypothetical protein
MIEDDSERLLAEVRHYRSPTYAWLSATKPARTYGKTHDAVLARVDRGMSLGYIANALIFGPRYLSRSEHKALVQLVQGGRLRVLRVSGSDIERFPPPPRGYEYTGQNYVIAPAGAERDRRRGPRRR